VRRGALILVAVAVFGACSSSGSSSSSRARSPGPGPVLHVVTQNILHGNACATDTDLCRIGARVDLFAKQLEVGGCPEIVGVEEANPRFVKEARRALPSVCGGRYRIVYDGDPSEDREVVLTTDPILGSERTHVAGPLRTAYWVRVKSAAGPVDVVVTHLASDSDNGPCDRTTCPPPCQATDQIGTCGGRLAAAFLDRKRDPHSVAIFMGDLNAHPNDETVKALLADGYVDTFAAVGNAECDPKTGVNCTSGRVDTSLVDLTNPNAKESERIDYVFLAPTPRCRVGKPSGVFAPSGRPVGKNGLVFPSDHAGVEATMACSTSPSDLAAATVVVTTSTTAVSATTVAPATAAAITQAYKTVLQGATTSVATRVASLEDGETLRDSLAKQLQDEKAVLPDITVRIDSMKQTGADRVDLTYTILLKGVSVLDHLPGAAVRVGDKWLMARTTYCAVARQGQSTIPEGCG
jgi:endonuclease/exonuclease/phosphatase family metal-dependent hydrolase